MTEREVIEKIQAKRVELEKFQVHALFLFGSTVRNEANEDSDIDLLVQFEEGARVGFFEVSRLKYFLSELLGAEVDLATPDSLHRALKEEILHEAVRAA